jgi:hypothetical protein
MEKERDEMSVADMERSFETVGMHSKEVPQFFVWKADDIRIRPLKK